MRFRLREYEQRLVPDVGFLISSIAVASGSSRRAEATQ